MSNVNVEQVNKCLFNGNYKLGKLCGGWHSVDNVRARGINLPDNLPDNTKSFLFFSGNVILYVSGGIAYYNTDSAGKLSDIQKASYEYITNVLKNKKVKTDNVALGWHNVGGGKSISLDDKIAGML